MKTPDDNKLDRLFREGLNSPNHNPDFREDDWDAMERLLDEKPRKDSGIIWLYWLSGSIAALLLLFFGWTLLKPTKLVENNTAKVFIRKKASIKNNGNNVVLQKKPFKKITEAAELAVSKKKIYADKNNIEKSINQPGLAKTATDKTLLASGNRSNKINLKHNINNVFDKKRNNSSTNNLVVKEASSAQKQTIVLADNQVKDTAHIYEGKRSIDLKATALNVSQAKNNFADNATRLAVTPKATDLLANRKPTVKTKIPAKTSLKMPPQFSLAILSAPDVNGVSSFTGAKVGTNVGLQISIQLTRKWSINTGAAYASKPYEIDMQQYQNAATYWGKQGEVAADCKVLDIPINLNYQVFSKNRNSFAAGAGLSSYFMLRENYNFYYTDNTSYSRNIVNQNKHILGILNLNATYQRQVNTNFNLIVQPYLKLPLTPIGYEKINLQSAGIAVGVGWNIRSFKNK